MGIAPAQPITVSPQASVPECRFCDTASQPPEQFYETKLFRVLVKRNPIVEGHVFIMPKKHDPHFYGFDLDQLEEFSYLIKKVSFIAMRLTHATGFTMLMNDGTVESTDHQHLEIDIIPRLNNDAGIAPLLQQQTNSPQEIDDSHIAAIVMQLHDLMQLPQE
jgi:diadenosine tetraphosphate (Ap4A) HIT family hydrolase